MATYAIGDVQGCFSELTELVAQCAFDPKRDRLWFVGDLVNRGPDSLEVLRYVMSLGEAATCVLGNHDLHLLALAVGERKLKRGDTLAAIVEAKDFARIIDWLRHRPILHVENGYALVHAGIHPRWSVDDCKSYASEIEHVLRGRDWRDGFARFYRKKPRSLSPDLPPYARLRALASVFTTLRTCTPEGDLDVRFVGPPEKARPPHMPWYELTRLPGHTIVFGHWATLGLLHREHVIGLDTGCVWGGKLTAMRLEDKAIFQVESRTNADGAD